MRDIDIKKMMKLKILQKKMVLKMKIIIKKKAFIKLVECAHMNFELSACCSLQLVCWSKLELRLQGGTKEETRAPWRHLRDWNSVSGH